MARLMLEVLEHDGTVRSRARMASFPFTIGRGFANDLILDDPYADAIHVRLIEDGAGGVLAEDAGSVNGTHEFGLVPVPGNGPRVTPGVRTERVGVRAGTQLRVGRTVIRFRDIDQPVPAALPDHRDVDRSDAVVGWITGDTTSKLVCVMAFVVFAVTDYFDASSRVKSGEVLTYAIGMMGLIAIWSALWALVSRVMMHRSHYGGHYALTCTAVLGMIALFIVTGWVDYILPAEDLVATMNVLGAGTILVFLLRGHLALASAMLARRRWVIASSIVGGVLATAALIGHSSLGDFSTRLRYESNLKPLSPRWVHAVPVNAFVDATSSLREDVDELAKK